MNENIEYWAVYAYEAFNEDSDKDLIALFTSEEKAQEFIESCKTVFSRKNPRYRDEYYSYSDCPLKSCSNAYVERWFRPEIDPPNYIPRNLKKKTS